MEDLLLNTEEYILKAKDHIDCWDYIQAKRLLIELLEDEPDNAQAHQLLGWIYASQLSQYTLAERHFKLAIKFDANHTSSYCDYIYLMKMQGRYTDMIKLADQVLDKSGYHRAYILKNKAEAFEMLGQYDQAIATCKSALLQALETDMLTSCEQALERIEKKMSISRQNSFVNVVDVA